MSATTDPGLRSFVDVPAGHPFPIQNLPYGVYLPDPGQPPRVGVAIGDYVLDLAILEERGFFEQTALGGHVVFARGSLNALLALGPAAWRDARAQISRLLRADVPTLRDDVALREQALVLAAGVTLRLPCEIGDYTDFYCSRHHALNVGRIFRGADAALLPNFEHMPIGYHGRASSVVVSGTDVRRPRGQMRPPGAERPVFGPTRELDFELEVGWFIGRGNAMGQPISIARAPNQIFGLVLVNDWSARDIQQWEYVPLGPFLGKSFATSISPWVVPMEALEPFRCAPPAHEVPPPEYLQAKGNGAYDLHLEVTLQAADMATPQVVCRTNFRDMYWTPAQMVAHHTVAGCNLRPGDLLASGTVSGSATDSRGCLLERTWRGAEPLALSNGERRAFLHDGDTVVLRGWCEGDGYRVGLGECRGSIVGADD